MQATPTRTDICALYSTNDSVLPITASYLLSATSQLVVVDPGTASHVEAHVEKIRELALPTDKLVAVIQSPTPDCMEAVASLAGMSSDRTVILHWRFAAIAEKALPGWRIRTITSRGASLRLSQRSRLFIAVPEEINIPGSLVSFETSTGTLLSGQLYGSLGPGTESDLPAIRRESVRAYRDVVTPGVVGAPSEELFGSAVPVAQVAPMHGKLVIGGVSMIRELFREPVIGSPVQSALHRLFLRIAAVAGFNVAREIYRASRVPVPDADAGFESIGVRPNALTVADWSRALECAEKWLSAAVLDAVYPLVAAVISRYSFPPCAGASRFLIRQRQSSAGEVYSETESVDEGPVADDGLEGAIDDSRLLCPITRLMNESVFKRRLENDLSREDLSGREAVIVVGVDGLERVNTTYGRRQGDHVLRTVAYLLRNFQASRSRMGTHRLYKLTGPHFAYVLTRDSSDSGPDVAEQLRRAVAESAMFLERTTVSVGVVGFNDPAVAEDLVGPPASRVEAITSRAFARLRWARSSGANTVCSSEPSTSISVTQGATVLIADPDAPYLQTLTRHLEERGYALLSARDGAEAIEIVDNIRPDAIVAEVMLPKVNGFELREHLRHNARLSSIPFILVSHRKTDEAIDKAAMVGIVHYLKKPFSLVELGGLLRNLTGNRPAIHGSSAEGQ